MQKILLGLLGSPEETVMLPLPLADRIFVRPESANFHDVVIRFTCSPLCSLVT